MWKRLVRISLPLLGFAFLLAPSRSAFALSQNELVSGGSVWLETTIAVALAFVSAMAFSLQIARGYFIRILTKFTLRLGADIWWLAYILIRDGLIFVSFIMGLLVFFPGTFLDYPMAVPFMPLSVVLFGIALIVKLYFDADDNRKAFRAVTVLVFTATLLWIFGTVFITETPLALSTLPPGVSSTGGLWFYMYNMFSSTNNLALTMATFQICFAVLGILAFFGFAHPILHSRLPRLKKGTMTMPTSAPPTSPQSMPLSSRGSSNDADIKNSISKASQGSIVTKHIERDPKDRSMDYIA